MVRVKAAMVAQIKTKMGNADENQKKSRRKLKKTRDRLMRKQIRINQASGAFKIPKEPVKRLIREIAEPFNSNVLISSQAFELLQAAGEDVLTELMQDANKIATEIGKRATVLPQDVRAAAHIRKNIEQRFHVS